jgi:hypothetical protein
MKYSDLNNQNLIHAFFSEKTLSSFYTPMIVYSTPETQKTLIFFVETQRDYYKLTLNDPDSIDDFLGIHFSQQDKVELHMSQTGFIDAVTEIAHIPKG